MRELLRIEDTRWVGEVTDADLSHGDPRVRRAAVRALARAELAGSRDRLMATLADHDPDVLSWSAYGLGRVCSWDREKTTGRLVMRGVSLGSEPGIGYLRLDPWVALAGALGKCGTPEGEKTLVAWLSGPKDRSVAAVTGLGSVVTKRKRMEEETAAALLRATRGDAANDPLSAALFPFGRLKRAPVRVEEQLLQACRKRLGHDVPSRVFVLRALGTLGDEAVPVLGTVLRSDAGYAATERVEAARALGKIDTDAARKELVAAIDELAPPNDPVALTSLVGPGFGTLMTALGSVSVSGKRGVTSKGLVGLMDLDPPPGAPPAVVRRVVLLRCAAARLVAGDRFDHPKLTSCDPGGSDVGSLARLAVIDRGELVGARAKAWRSYLDAKQSVVVREAALKMVAGHAEAKGVASVVAKALGDEKLGVVTEAALLVAAHPDRFMTKEEPPKPEAGVVKALQAAVKRAWLPDAIETKGALARACGAMRMDETKPWLEQLCKGPNPTLREHGKAALSALGGPVPTCEAASGYAPAAELGRIVMEPRKIVIDTEVGKLFIELDPGLAPVATTRIGELVARKFYDDMAVHRVVPGFVVQFGDREGDGYGGVGLEALRCETSPVPFEKGVVGIALGGRDTGSSQVFVTLGPAPHLDGEYAVIGKATGPWELLAEGDRIRTARIE